MTGEELRREAGLVLAAAKSTMDVLGVAEPLFMLHWPTDVHRTHPATIESLGTLDLAVALAVRRPGDWMKWPIPGSAMDSGPARMHMFSALRTAVQQSGADATLFCCEVWYGKPTALGLRHKTEIRVDTDPGFERLLRKGWVVRAEAVSVTAQTSTEVLLLTQEFRRRSRMKTVEWIGAAVGQEVPQADYDGGAKMFGPFDQDTLGEPPAGSYADRHNRGEE